MYDYSGDSDYEAEMIIEFTGQASDLQELEKEIMELIQNYNSVEAKEI